MEHTIDREWYAAKALHIVDTKRISPRRAIASIPQLEAQRNSEITSAVHALVFETVRRLNVINRIGHEVVQQHAGNLFGKNNPSLKHLPAFVRSLFQVALYRLVFEQHAPALVTHTMSVLLRQNTYARFIQSMGVWLHHAENLDVAQLVQQTQDEAEQLGLETYHPTWLTRQFIQTYGFPTAKEILTFFTAIPPAYIRLNTLKDVEFALNELAEKKVEFVPDPYLKSVLRIIKTNTPLPRFESFSRGYFYIQSRGSAFISHYLDPQQGETILDVCAAPGSKTTHIASLTKNKAKIIAMEINARRLTILDEILERYNVSSATTLLADGRNPPVEHTFDRILLDAPCSGTGTLATRPYIKWRLTKKLLHKYARLQTNLLNGVADLLKPGGKLLYATCSLLPEENEQVIQQFLSTHTAFEPAKMTLQIGESLAYNGQRLLPQTINSEGFSVFLLEKIAMT